MNNMLKALKQKNQILLWGAVSLISPFCAFTMWYSNQNKRVADILAALPIAALFTEWYVTGNENTMLLIAYLGMIICLLIYVPKTAKRRLSIILIATVMTLFLIKTGLLDFVCETLLNI